MNKEELERNLKYTEKKHRNDTVNTFDTDISMMCVDVLKVLKNCIEIPEEATNGDMIKAMFPDLESKEKAFEIEVNENKNKVGNISVNWWNAPYKKGTEE